MSNRESADVDLDQNLRCAACGDGFVFTAGEQELYRLRGITAQPQRCPTCARGGGGGSVLASSRRGT